MIEIKVPKEIREYKEKILFGLTIRQLFSLIIALAVCIPLYIFGKDALGEDLIGWIVILVAAPIFAFGFAKPNGMNFEHFVVLLLRQQLIEPQKRKYEELPVFWYCRQEIIDNEIAHQQAELKRENEKSKRKAGRN